MNEEKKPLGAGVFDDFDVILTQVTTSLSEADTVVPAQATQDYKFIDIGPMNMDLSEIPGAPREINFERDGVLSTAIRCVTQKPVLPYPIKPTTLYPSAASCIKPDGTVIGKCLRQAWYAIQIGKVTPRWMSKSNFWVTQLGEFVESRVIDHLRELGAYVPGSSQHPIYVPGVGISGKIDFAFVDRGDVCIGEVKSTSEKNIPFMDGSIPWGSTPSPSDSHLMQTMLYLNEMAAYGVARAHILYVCRDSGRELEFKVRLVKCHDGQTRAVTALIGANYNLVDYISLESIMARYEALRDYVDTETMPPRDYELFYTPEEMNNLIEVKKKWRKNTNIAKDFAEKGKCARRWQCTWCEFVDECYKDDKRLTPSILDEIKKEVSRED